MGATARSKDVGLYLAPIPYKVRVKKAFKDLWIALFAKDMKCIVCVVNEKGRRTLKNLIKKGLLIEDSVEYQFSDQAVQNMMNSYDPVTGKMEITGGSK